jgi:hypothetical protein
MSIVGITFKYEWKKTRIYLLVVITDVVITNKLVVVRFLDSVALTRF